MTVTHKFIYFDIFQYPTTTPPQSTSLISYHLHNMSDYLVNDSLVRKTTETAIGNNINYSLFLSRLGNSNLQSNFRYSHFSIDVRLPDSHHQQ